MLILELAEINFTVIIGELDPPIQFFRFIPNFSLFGISYSSHKTKGLLILKAVVILYLVVA